MDYSNMVVIPQRTDLDAAEFRDQEFTHRTN